MFPIRDHNPSTRTPWITWALIATNVVIHMWVVSTFQNDAQLYRFYADWAMIPQFVSKGHGLEGLVTSTFLHADLWHLGGNMLFLWIYGDNLEDALGRVGFLLFYLFCGVVAGLAQGAIEPWSLVPTIGASGAIAGVMGGYLLLFPRAKVDVLIFLVIFIRIIPLNAWLILSVWLVFQLVGGFGSDASGGGVAYWAHIGGFAAGLIVMVPVWLRRGGTRLWAASDGHPPHPEAQYGAIRTSTVPQVRRALTRRSPWDR